MSEKNITRYLANKKQLSIFQNHVNGVHFLVVWLLCLIQFMLITFDNEVCLTFDNEVLPC